MRSRFWIGLLSGILVITCAVSCTERIKTGPTIEEYRSVDLDDVESVLAEIQMGVGRLEIRGGSRDLLEAEFAYNVEEWKPEIEYGRTAKQGRLTVRGPDEACRGFGRKVKYEWDLRLNDSVPMELSVELGAGESRLDLGELNLKSLDIATGAGSVVVDLIGSRALEDLNMETGAGSVVVDLTGDWDHDLDAEVTGGIGKVTLRLPADVGVRVNASKGIGKTSARGLIKRGGSYVNEAYGESDVTLDIDVETGIGAIDLELEDSSELRGTTI
jgi:hypothetical protein